MVQESIVDYINAQTKLGVSRDTIKATLTGAGWVAADVEDTFKKIESANMAQPASSVSASPTTSPMAKPVESIIASKPAASAVSAVSPAASPTIKMSDLVSSTSSAPASKSPLTGPSVAAKPLAMNMPVEKSSNSYQASAYPAAKSHGSRGALIVNIILIVLVIGAGGLAGFLYMQNNSLNAQLGTLNGQSSGVNSQLSALQSQVAASSTALTAQVSALTAETQELRNELSVYAVPSSTTPGVSSTLAVSGTVSGGGKALYAITTTYGAKIYIANSKATSVIAAFIPFMAIAAPSVGTTTASSTASTTAPATPAAPAAPVVGQFSGTYIPGLDSMTLTAVNGTALQ